MQLYESETPSNLETEPELFEDVTQNLFDLVDDGSLGDSEIIGKLKDFNFEETLSSIEVIDLKMDQRTLRNVIKETKQE